MRKRKWAKPTLDIGCGGQHKGDINLDLHKPCDVLGSCNNLPFQDNTFRKATINHVLEHKGVNPVKTLDEALRVAEFVEATVPASWHPYSRIDKSHDKFFNRSWFKRYATSRNCNVNCIQRFDIERSFFLFGVEIVAYLIPKHDGGE